MQIRILSADPDLDPSSSLTPINLDPRGSGSETPNYREEWGEQMVGKSQPVIVRLGLLTEQPVDIKASPGFDLSILRHRGIWGAADEAVLNTVHRRKKI